MPTVSCGLLDILKMVKSVDHQGNAAIILQFYRAVTYNTQVYSRAPLKKSTNQYWPVVLKQPLVLLEIIVVEIIQIVVWGRRVAAARSLRLLG